MHCTLEVNQQRKRNHQFELRPPNHTHFDSVVKMADAGRAKRLYSPTGRTPHKPKTKRAVVGDRNVSTIRQNTRKKLTYSQSMYTPVQSWSEEEDRAITQFILLSVGNSWPSTKSTKLWEGAAKFLLDTCKTVRTSKEL